jgi:hypothetical protein
MEERAPFPWRIIFIVTVAQENPNFAEPRRKRLQSGRVLLRGEDLNRTPFDDHIERARTNRSIQQVTDNEVHVPARSVCPNTERMTDASRTLKDLCNAHRGRRQGQRGHLEPGFGKRPWFLRDATSRTENGPKTVFRHNRHQQVVAIRDIMQIVLVLY